VVYGDKWIDVKYTEDKQEEDSTEKYSLGLSHQKILINFPN